MCIYIVYIYWFWITSSPIPCIHIHLNHSWLNMLDNTLIIIDLFILSDSQILDNSIATWNKY